MMLEQFTLLYRYCSSRLKNRNALLFCAHYAHWETGGCVLCVGVGVGGWVRPKLARYLCWSRLQQHRRGRRRFRSLLCALLVSRGLISGVKCPSAVSIRRSRRDTLSAACLPERVACACCGWLESSKKGVWGSDRASDDRPRCCLHMCACDGRVGEAESANRVLRWWGRCRCRWEVSCMLDDVNDARQKKPSICAVSVVGSRPQRRAGSDGGCLQRARRRRRRRRRTGRRREMRREKDQPKIEFSQNQQKKIDLGNLRGFWLSAKNKKRCSA